MPEERASVTVRVPATSANLGSGFDTLGLALDVWNDLTVTRSEKFSMDIIGEGADHLPRDQTNLVCVGLKAAFEKAGKPVPLVSYSCKNRIPFGRGLGTSSAAIVSGLVAGLVLAGHELPVKGEESLLQLACTIEGHPDNVAPAIYGGLQLGVHHGGRWHTNRIPVPHGLVCTLFIPDKTMLTSEARALLPQQYSTEDVVFNMSRCALLVHAMSSGNLEYLRVATEDRIHQPYRGKVMPHLFPMIEAALEAGAHACYLSGAGSSVLAITSGRSGDTFTQRQEERAEKAVQKAMEDAAAKVGCSGRIFITWPTDQGAHVVNDPLESGQGAGSLQAL